MLEHKYGIENKVVDALSHIGYLLHTMRVEVIGFDRLKNTYSACLDFNLIYLELLASNHQPNVNFVLHDSCLFRVLNYASFELHSETS